MYFPIWKNGIPIFDFPVLLADGTVAAPSLAFAGDPDTGWYWSSANVLGIAVSGTRSVTISGNTLDLWSDTHKIRFGLNQDVVLDRLGANSLALRNSTNAQTFTVGPSGNAIALVGTAAGAAPYVESLEGTAPAAPAANGWRLFAQDNGSGKTQLMVIFASGAAQQIAIQP